MARLADLVFDCLHPAPLARFWSAVLDNYSIAPYDDRELARLAALGVTDVEDDPTVLLEPTDAGPRIWFQTVPESKTCKNRVHVDVSAVDRHAEAERLISLGAVLVADSASSQLTTMRDPEGNEFCIVE